MIREQAIIKAPGGVEFPVLAFDENLTWLIVAMIFIIALIWVLKKH